jgi:NarL family two-component system response regulator LiaR
LELGLRSYDDKIQVVGEADDGLEAVKMCALLEPDVVIMDVVMPNMDGPNAIQLIRDRYPHIRILVLSNFPDEEYVHAAIQAGAMGYLMKDISVETLVAAIHDVMRGKSTLAPEATQALVNVTQHPPREHYDLTPRERQILDLLVQGLTNREIAHELSVSLSTVKRYVSEIFYKINVSNRSEAVARVLRQKLN